MATSSTTVPRLRLSATPGQGPLDGAWWPRTRDLEVELRALVDGFPSHAGQISRALFSPPDWDTTPRRIRINGGYLKTGSFPGDDTHVVLLRLATRKQLAVLVVPPATPDDTAERLLATATAAGNKRTATQLIVGPPAP